MEAAIKAGSLVRLDEYWGESLGLVLRRFPAGLGMILPDDADPDGPPSDHFSWYYVLFPGGAKRWVYQELVYLA